MKRLSLFFLFLAFLGNTWAQLYSTTQNVNFREQPSVEGLIRYVISKGTLVTVLEMSEGWSKVSINKDTGFVSSTYLMKFAQGNSLNSYEKVHYYKNSAGEKVQSPTYYKTAPAGATAECRDGTYSFSQNRRGTCSHHGGVKRWLK